jgi:rare lipoprotein A
MRSLLAVPMLICLAVVTAVVTADADAGEPAAKVTPPLDTSSPAVQAQARKLDSEPPVAPPSGRRVQEDRSGRKEVGKASVYATRFAGRHMADGRRFHQTGSAAASKSLPIGTVAKVTNQKTGQTAIVTIEDHGPYRNGRAIDVSRHTANDIGLTRHDGVTPVTVAPVAVPQPDGTVKPGAGAVPGPARP